LALWQTDDFELRKTWLLFLLTCTVAAYDKYAQATDFFAVSGLYNVQQRGLAFEFTDDAQTLASAWLYYHAFDRWFSMPAFFFVWARFIYKPYMGQFAIAGCLGERPIDTR
jgi:hypothetical protein